MTASCRRNLTSAVHLGAGRLDVLGFLDHEDVAVGPSRVSAVPQNAARVVIVSIVDDPGEDLAPAPAGSGSKKVAACARPRSARPVAKARAAVAAGAARSSTVPAGWGGRSRDRSRRYGLPAGQLAAAPERARAKVGPPRSTDGSVYGASIVSRGIPRVPPGAPGRASRCRSSRSRGLAPAPQRAPARR